ncbi:hypothetical protein Tco_1578930 [Tanacetum coccineum]
MNKLALSLEDTITPSIRMWELSVYAMAGYMHLNKDPDNGEQGHNKAGCKNESRPQPKKVVKPNGINRQPVRPQYASRGGGRGSRGGRMGRGNETMNFNKDAQAGVGRGNVGVGRGNTVGRGRGRGRRGGGRGRDEQEHYLRQDEEALREHLEETARVEQEYLDRYRAEQEYEARMDWIHESHWQSDEDMLANNPTQTTQQSGVQQVQAMATQQSVDH